MNELVSRLCGDATAKPAKAAGCRFSANQSCEGCSDVETCRIKDFLTADRLEIDGDRYVFPQDYVVEP